MSDSESDEENHISYGTPLDPYEEDEIPSKRKYQQMPDQYAVDAHGKRRFHGAFTGGFSAGYGNTVGTPEGWTPSSFKSSRREKALVETQKPEDFMDEEDCGEFGIAPRQMQTHNEFSGQKRKVQRRYHDGPIPGEPVLTQLFHAVHETAAVRMLRSMGWKEGQGTGDRMTSKEKKKAKEQHKVYGCYIPEEFRQETNVSEDSSDSEFDYEALFAPDDYEPYILNRKNDRFGLGYSGLSRHSVLGPMRGEYGETSSTSHLVMKEKGKKVSIRGHAFGVGAFEADDEDIYAMEDMSHYDYAIGGAASSGDKKATKPQKSGVLEGFVKAIRPMPAVPSYPPPALPRDYVPAAAGARRSRFEPADQPQRNQGLGRHELTPTARGELLGEKPLNTDNGPKIQANNVDPIAKLLGRNVNFVSQNTEDSKQIEELPNVAMTSADSEISANEDFIPISSNNTSSVVKPFIAPLNSALDNKNVHNTDKNSQEVNLSSSKADTPVSTLINYAENTQTSQEYISILDSGKPIQKVFKPFKSDPKKQARYEMYLKDKEGVSNRDSDTDRVSGWERERELAEFEQASKLYRPLDGIMGDRFTHASEPDEALNPLCGVARSLTGYGMATQDQIEAAKKGLYGALTRTEVPWRPEALVCKRFNVPQPGVAREETRKEDKPKVSYSIFSYLESSMHDKDSFAKEQSKFSGSKSLRWDVKERKPSTSDQKPSTSKIEDVNNKDVINKAVTLSTDISKGNEMNVRTGNNETGFAKRLTTVELFLKESEKSKESGIEVTETINKFDKMDLYKSIFLSDSEEDEKIDDKEEDKSKKDDFIDKPKNVERNTSPPRGIFANIDFDELNSWRRKTDEKPQTDTKNTEDKKQTETVVEARACTPVTHMDVEVYGPKIPENLQKRLESESERLETNSVKEVLEVKSSSEDSWVDVNEVKKNKSKKKKSKKQKSKHKKSKHKKKDR